MGLSVRYHAASLAAVFLALAIGILIGSQYGGDLLTSTRKDLERSLTRDLGATRNEVSVLKRRAEWSDRFGRTVLPLLTEFRLAGQRIGLVGFGDLPTDVTDAVEQALEPTGGQLVAVGVVRHPPDLNDLSESLAGTRFASLEERPQELGRFGRSLGRQLVIGGRVLQLSRSAAFSSSSGQFGGLDALLAYRSIDTAMDENAIERSKVLDTAVLDGVSATGVRMIGIGKAGNENSDGELFLSRNATTVDNVEMASGKLSLVYTLDGAEGNFGVGKGAARLMPELLQPAFTTGPRQDGQPGRRG